MHNEQHQNNPDIVSDEALDGLVGKIHDHIARIRKFSLTGQLLSELGEEKAMNFILKNWARQVMANPADAWQIHMTEEEFSTFTDIATYENRRKALIKMIGVVSGGTLASGMLYSRARGNNMGKHEMAASMFLVTMGFMGLIVVLSAYRAEHERDDRAQMRANKEVRNAIAAGDDGAVFAEAFYQKMESRLNAMRKEIQKQKGQPAIG